LKTQDDILLLNLLREGDEKAFKYLFDTYFSPLCQYMNLYLSDTGESEENVLDIYTYLWENRANIDIRISFRAYLFQAARNKCLNSLRNRRNKVPLESVEHELSDLEDTGLELEELNKLIEEAILQLPEKCRDVFVASRWENLKNREIADKMQISIKTVETQISKALKFLRKYLGENYSYLF